MGKLANANNVAVVTGASKGIGTSIGKHLAAEGASVVVNYSTSKEVDAITKSLAKDSRRGRSA
jgi:3-oxoacyl-[acyl-carrier protein] reductase